MYESHQYNVSQEIKTKSKHYFLGGKTIKSKKMIITEVKTVVSLGLALGF